MIQTCSFPIIFHHELPNLLCNHGFCGFLFKGDRWEIGERMGESEREWQRIFGSLPMEYRVVTHLPILQYGWIINRCCMDTKILPSAKSNVSRNKYMHQWNVNQEISTRIESSNYGHRAMEQRFYDIFSFFLSCSALSIKLIGVERSRNRAR